jgi:hypothetical protein
MRPQLKEPLFNSKELNKILPSYLFDEIDEEQKELNHKKHNKQRNFVLPKELKKVSKKHILIFLFCFFIYVECKYQQCFEQ